MLPLCDTYGVVRYVDKVVKFINSINLFLIVNNGVNDPGGGHTLVVNMLYTTKIRGKLFILIYKAILPRN